MSFVFDACKNFAVTSVTVAPTPAISGTKVTVKEAAALPEPPFDMTVAPSLEALIAGKEGITAQNSEIWRVTAKTGNELTIERQKQESTARACVVGDQIYQGVTRLTLEEIYAAINTNTAAIAAETTRAEDTEGTLMTNLVAEVMARKTAVTAAESAAAADAKAAEETAVANAASRANAAQAAAEAASAQGFNPTAIKTGAYTATPGDYVPVDISGGSVPVALPSAPADKARIGLKIVAISGTPGSTTLTINRGGSDVFNVAAGSTSLTLSAKFQGVVLQYKASTGIWYVQTTDTPLNEALGAALLGTDGTVGGPSGSALTSSVVSGSTLPTRAAPMLGIVGETPKGEQTDFEENEPSSIAVMKAKLGGRQPDICFYQNGTGSPAATLSEVIRPAQYPFLESYAPSMMPMASWIFPQTLTSLSAANISSGDRTKIKEAAVAIREYGKPVLLRPGKEFNGGKKFGLQYGNENETAKGFVEGWQNLAKILREEGAHNALLVFNPTIWGAGHTPLNPCIADGSGVNWYPGDSYVDLVGLDGYWLHGNAAATPTEVYMTPYEELTALTTKPFMICEIGCDQRVTGGQAKWFGEAFDMIRDKMARCVAVVFFLSNYQTGEQLLALEAGANAEEFKRRVNSYPFASAPGRPSVGGSALLGTFLSAFPALVNPAGPAHWRTARASAGSADAHIFYLGDSHTYGEFWTGSTLETANAECLLKSPAARLRVALAETYGDPGEGFLFPDDSRITGGGGIGTGVASGPAVLRHNRRFTSESHTLTFTIPAGKSITRFQVVAGNKSGETGTVTVKKNGSNVESITSAANDTPSLTTYACTEGDVFLLTGPASSAFTCIGFVIRTAQTHGVPVHRMGIMGYTSPNVLGGVYNGILGSPEGSTVLTPTQITQEIRAAYAAFGTPALVIVQFGTNEVTKQLEVAGIDCGVTPGLFQVTLETIVKQVSADGGCVLLVSPCPSASEKNTEGNAPLSSYAAMAYFVANTNANCAMIDIASNATWGGGFAGLDSAGEPVPVTDAEKAAAVAAAATALLRDPGSSHPTPLGYQSYANIVHEALLA